MKQLLAVNPPGTGGASLTDDLGGESVTRFGNAPHFPDNYVAVQVALAKQQPFASKVAEILNEKLGVYETNHLHIGCLMLNEVIGRVVMTLMSSYK